MSHVPVDRLDVLYEPDSGHVRQVGTLASTGGRIFFAYAPEFLATKLELSPFKLPLRPGVMDGDPGIFSGLMGVFEDSLPDGWGRLLFDRQVAKAGLSPAKLGPLDRLAMVGGRAIGALVYRPQINLKVPTIVDLAKVAAEVLAAQDGVGAYDLGRLLALGGSPQGARPKALIQMTADGSLIYGDAPSRADCLPYLIKFLARGDSPYTGALECAYMRMAAAAGIDVPPTRMLGRTTGHPGYFAVQRFDREGQRRIHAHTMAGLLHAPHYYPSATYTDLLRLTRDLTRDETAVRENFRRACFNVFAHNRDDHTRNFAFLMGEDGRWRPSPAYDLTFSDGPGGEHSLLVGREGANPTEKDLTDVAQSVDLAGAREIIAQVREAVELFVEHAAALEVPTKMVVEVAKVLRVKTSRRRRPKG